MEVSKVFLNMVAVGLVVLAAFSINNVSASAANVALGTYIGIPGDAGTTAQWNEFVAAMGATPTVMLAYTDANQPTNTLGSYGGWVSSWFNGAATAYLAGVTPEWDIYTAYKAGPGDKYQQWRDYANGVYDSQITTAITAFKNQGISRMYLRIGSEFNGNWSGDYVASVSDAQLFVAAWRRIAQQAHSVAGIQVITEWNPNNGTIPSMSASYPGDDVVDMISIDAYGAPVDGSSPSAGGSDTSVTTSALANFAKSHGKPFAASELGGLDASWTAAMGAELAQLVQSGVTLDHISLWDPLPDGSGDLDFTRHQDVINAWKTALGQINAACNNGGSCGGGAQASSGGGGTPVPMTGQCTEAYTSTVAVPQGYGAAYNIFSTSKEYVVSADCAPASPILTIGSGSESQYIYKIGYVYKGGAWQMINLTGPGALISNNWYAANASGPLPYTATDLSSNWNYIVGYVCTWNGSAWKCGCSDTACAASNWQLQAIRR